ncbi:alpha/beta hydrolase [Bradyrhizobium sp. U87765 SZCCT0131]|uniref:alpha/beta fold hydrolase n=1 Tax=unclassified Bradyrhizobium TaxID=2631580 RepID=UPI001BA77D09|nr:MULTISPECIES: alpha/beta hydrolase [unclassified Bradyrhizobium]MBR1218703.1 alpha/beta hydrolase [Bradyrhizobium sp. U87765 SZCCT0131]MBR1265538.1 alpha/beta hydrolase [Bradyrhizobium sp. U87765 SZCCT0134]MBR1304202.1 alpha/beta hydrolase [Bradyrhizobium sp. U87765 SZCCT0110]MBR1319807.1 alpha/beta hydrolase [Bradyrhizobium sp. U87765 SZCCT0109]MBR1348133.1 alpha/beta hydrolase [Bradyrhizobium sp. U87765 SZCCT0048]
MSDLADLFPGFASEWIATSRGRIFARIGGNGPPLMLLHGYPQTHVMWHKVAPQLAGRFTLVIPDLPGYGWSDVPKTDADHTPFTKRAMAQAMIEVMDKFGHAQFMLAGHDRGGRVTYRLALDHPGRLSRLATLDILPTYDYWAKMDRAFGLRAYHWLFLAQPSPLPEKLIQSDPDGYFGPIFQGWAKKDVPNPFDPRAVAHYLTALRDPLRIHAACEDYRAGAYADLEHDTADRNAGKTITAPLLALWGAAGFASVADAPLDAWRAWATNVSGAAVDAGHFLCEENPDATASALLNFFSE